MVKYNDSTTYENYFHLRRQLGEQEYSDLSQMTWDAHFAQSSIINQMLLRCYAMMKDRDLSWKNYRDQYPSGAYRSEEWENVPLFVKASIIKPHTGVHNQAGDQDIPESETIPW